MHTPAKFLAAALLALSCHAYADPAADIVADWGKLGETQQTMVFLRVATLYTAMELEQAKLPDSHQRNASEPDDAGQRLVVPKAFQRSARYLQQEIQECYATAGNQTPQADTCAEADNILADHLKSDHAHNEARIGRFAFSYRLHPQTRQWNRRHAGRLPQLAAGAAEARRLFKEQSPMIMAAAIEEMAEAMSIRAKMQQQAQEN